MPSGHAEIIQALQDQLQKGVKSYTGELISSGSAALDAIAGFRRGTLVEWLGGEGGGATTLAAALARQATSDARPLVVIDPQRRIYPPALAVIGIDLRRVVLAFPSGKRDYEWTLNQALGCPAVAAVLCWPSVLDNRTFRRLQLSAEQGGSLGLMVRDMSAVHEPSWADTRLVVEPVPVYGQRRFRVEELHCRGVGVSGRSVEVEISEEGLLHDARPVHPVSQLAPATTAQRSARA